VVFGGVCLVECVWWSVFAGAFGCGCVWMRVFGGWMWGGNNVLRTLFFLNMFYMGSNNVIRTLFSRNLALQGFQFRFDCTLYTVRRFRRISLDYIVQNAMFNRRKKAKKDSIHAILVLHPCASSLCASSLCASFNCLFHGLLSFCFFFVPTFRSSCPISSPRARPCSF
jgi:hypothetical protein